MKVRVQQDELNAAVAWLRTIAPQRAYLPALSGIRCTAEDGWLTMQATDLERAGTMGIPAQVDEPGDVLVSVGMLSAIVAKLPDAPVTLAAEDTGISIQAGRVCAVVPKLPVEDFPKLPEPSDGVTFTMSSGLAESIAKRIVPAAATKDEKPFLTGVNLIATDGQLTVGATDKYRYHLLNVDMDVTGEAVALVPAPVFAQVAKMGGPAEVTIGDGMVSFQCGATILTTKVVPGEQPHPDRFFEVADGLPVTFDRAELLTSLDRCKVVASNGTNVPLRLTVEDGAAELAIGGGEFGQIIDVVSAEGSAPSVQMSPTYLASALDGFGTEQVVLHISPSKPVRVTDPDDGSYRAIVMPMR